MSEKTCDTIASIISYTVQACAYAGMLYISGIVIAGFMVEYLN